MDVAALISTQNFSPCWVLCVLLYDGMMPLCCGSLGAEAAAVLSLFHLTDFDSALVKINEKQKEKVWDGSSYDLRFKSNMSYCKLNISIYVGGMFNV